MDKSPFFALKQMNPDCEVSADLFYFKKFNTLRKLEISWLGNFAITKFYNLLQL